MARFSMGGHTLDSEFVDCIQVGYKTAPAIWGLLFACLLGAIFAAPKHMAVAIVACLVLCVLGLYEVLLHIRKANEIRIVMRGGRVVVLPCLSVDHRDETAARLESLTRVKPARSARFQGRALAG